MHQSVKRHLSRTLCLLLLAVLVGIVPAGAQQTQPPKKNPPPLQESQVTGGGRVTNVTVPVIVTDQDDRFIRELTKENFEISEDNKKQEIIGFQSSSDLPLFIAILLDTSSSVKGKLKFEKEATISFLQTVLRRRKDQALFVTFDSTVQLRQDFTDDTEALSKSIMAVKASGTTSLYDAVYRVCEEKMYNVPTPRKVIVILSDGSDTSSEKSLEDAIEIAQRNEVVVFGISTKGAGFFGVEAGQVLNEDDKELRKLCVETGGDITFPGKVLDLERAFQRYDKMARQYYLISYEPTDTDRPGFRKIDVKVVGRDNVRVRARKGYTVRKQS